MEGRPETKYETIQRLENRIRELEDFVKEVRKETGKALESVDWDGIYHKSGELINKHSV